MYCLWIVCALCMHTCVLLAFIISFTCIFIKKIKFVSAEFMNVQIALYCVTRNTLFTNSVAFSVCFFKMFQNCQYRWGIFVDDIESMNIVVGLIGVVNFCLLKRHVNCRNCGENQKICGWKRYKWTLRCYPLRPRDPWQLHQSRIMTLQMENIIISPRSGIKLNILFTLLAWFLQGS